MHCPKCGYTILSDAQQLVARLKDLNSRYWTIYGEQTSVFTQLERAQYEVHIAKQLSFALQALVKDTALRQKLLPSTDVMQLEPRTREQFQKALDRIKILTPRYEELCKSREAVHNGINELIAALNQHGIDKSYYPTQAE